MTHAWYHSPSALTLRPVVAHLASEVLASAAGVSNDSFIAAEAGLEVGAGGTILGGSAEVNTP